jgi:hypothetical protein
MKLAKLFAESVSEAHLTLHITLESHSKTRLI